MLISRVLCINVCDLADSTPVQRISLHYTVVVFVRRYTSISRQFTIEHQDHVAVMVMRGIEKFLIIKYRHKNIVISVPRGIFWWMWKLDYAPCMQYRVRRKNTPPLKMRFLINACRLLHQTSHTCLKHFCRQLQCLISKYIGTLEIGSTGKYSFEIFKCYVMLLRYKDSVPAGVTVKDAKRVFFT